MLEYDCVHKLRAAMVSPDRSLLTGLVEVDETYLGAPPRNRGTNDILEKTLIAGAVEVRTGKSRRGKLVTFPGRIRLRPIAARNKTVPSPSSSRTSRLARSSSPKV